ncbi:ribonuclease Z [Halorientalis regularis]|jgi:ribonuclease Z|uniref:Ribonuclease Z n=1 Tax=Halorientalis regularis TaxID=660518 RepID=A0A1G7T757_9EURY|nr:ribonuclease Z [Halorientalis regularis]SDG30902.1 RNAse Z [Halorientalis regularis]
MRVTAVGTSGGLPTSQYGTSCVYLSLFGDEILFDCGEGTLQRLMRYDASPNVDAVFISHFYADHTLGLPGLVQALEMNEREQPLDIYAPEQRTERVDEMIEGAYEWPSYGINVSGYDADEPAIRTDDYTVRAFSTPYTEHSHGFVVREADKREFLPETAQELGLDPGPAYGKLQNGQSVEADDGTTVEPADVLSEPEPGRKLVYTGDTRPTPDIVEAASDASLLIYSAMFTQEQAERARSTGHSTATEAAQVALESGSDRLWLTHISPRHEGEEETLETRARDEFDGEVTAVRDGDTTVLTQD